MILIKLLLALSTTASASMPCDQPLSEPLTFAKITEVLQVCQVTRLSELLKLFPLAYRSRYAFVYDSRSTQGASYLYPRTIFFSRDGKFLSAFAGDKSLKGYSSLEMIAFNDETKSFDFKFIDFPADEGKHKKGTKPKISSLNPPVCIQCHRSDPRPNWDTYEAWPGVYGSIDDYSPVRERTALKKFKDDVWMKKERYQFFTDAKDYPDNPVFHDYFPSRRNLQLGWLIGKLNAQKIARDIKNTPILRPFRYALLEAVTCKTNYADINQLSAVIPPSVTNEFKISFDTLKADTTAKVQASFAQRTKRQCDILAALPFVDPLEEWACKFRLTEFPTATSKFRYLFENKGLNLQDWSPELASQNYVYFTGPHINFGGLELFLWKEVLDPVDDESLYQVYETSWNNRQGDGDMEFLPAVQEKLCGELKQKSLATLGQP